MIRLSGWTDKISCTNCGDMFNISGEDVKAEVANISGQVADGNGGSKSVVLIHDVLYTISCISCGCSIEISRNSLPIIVRKKAEEKTGIKREEAQGLSDCSL